ncbi:hypothetical protein, partial [Aquimarina addita]|uniref:hypothetical protein n=1 Tax=Aquimarina addita TaxID=870485 RepID=UPI0031EF5911
MKKFQQFLPLKYIRMKVNNILYILAFCVNFLSAKATERPLPEPLTKKEIVAFGKQQLQELIQFNTENNKRGDISDNNYIFFTKNAALPLDKVKEYVWGTNYAGKEAQLEALNTKLKEINAGLKAPLYLGVNLDMGWIYLSKKVLKYTTLDKLKDIELGNEATDPDEAYSDIKKRFSVPIHTLYTEINAEITSTVENPITVNTIGFFQSTYFDSDTQKVKFQILSNQLVIMKNFHEDPEKSKKRASIIKEALRKDKLGISLAADRKSIDLVKSNNYFERYKA